MHLEQLISKLSVLSNDHTSLFGCLFELHQEGKFEREMQSIRAQKNALQDDVRHLRLQQESAHKSIASQNQDSWYKPAKTDQIKNVATVTSRGGTGNNLYQANNQERQEKRQHINMTMHQEQHQHASPSGSQFQIPHQSQQLNQQEQQYQLGHRQRNVALQQEHLHNKERERHQASSLNEFHEREGKIQGNRQNGSYNEQFKHQSTHNDVSIAKSLQAAQSRAIEKQQREQRQYNNTTTRQHTAPNNVQVNQTHFQSYSGSDGVNSNTNYNFTNINPIMDQQHASPTVHQQAMPFYMQKQSLPTGNGEVSSPQASLESHQRFKSNRARSQRVQGLYKNFQ